MTWIIWLLSAQSIALGYVYGGLALALGFAHKPYFDGPVLICWWRRHFHWASWLALSLLLAAPIVTFGVLGHWWSFGSAIAAAIVVVLFVVFVPRGYSTTIGHCMTMHPFHGTRTIFHERIHVRQYESLALLSAFVAAALFGLSLLSWQHALIVWATGGAPWLVPNFVAAGLRYWRPGVSFMDAVYYSHATKTGAEHEVSAYAQTALYYQ